MAHYLIQTRRANPDTNDNEGGKVPVSAKRSLPFSEIKVTVKENDLSKPSSESVDTKLAPESSKEPLLNPADDDPLTKDQVENALKPEHEKDSTGADNGNEIILSKDNELEKSSTICATVVEPETTKPLNDEVIIPELLERGGDDANGNEKENSALDNKDAVASETSPKVTKKRGCDESTPESIGGRLRKRRNENPGLDNEAVIASETSPTPTVKRACSQTTPDSIGARLRRRRTEANKI